MTLSSQDTLPEAPPDTQTQPLPGPSPHSQTDIPSPQYTSTIEVEYNDEGMTEVRTKDF